MSRSEDNVIAGKHTYRLVLSRQEGSENQLNITYSSIPIYLRYLKIAHLGGRVQNKQQHGDTTFICRGEA